jgi:hypothetical protein
MEKIADFLNTHTLMCVDAADVSVMIVLVVGLIIGTIYVKVKGGTFF